MVTNIIGIGIANAIGFCKKKKRSNTPIKTYLKLNIGRLNKDKIR